MALTAARSHGRVPQERNVGFVRAVRFVQTIIAQSHFQECLALLADVPHVLFASHSRVHRERRDVLRVTRTHRSHFRPNLAVSGRTRCRVRRVIRLGGMSSLLEEPRGYRCYGDSQQSML
jgi:hypothetical protein